MQGRDDGGRERLLADARALEDAGATRSCSRRSRPTSRARSPAALSIPTIGIGAGAGCDGQVLVCYDMLGMDETFKPRFVRRYATLGATIKDAVGHYVTEVRGGDVPVGRRVVHASPRARRAATADPALYSTAAAKK